VTDQPTVRPAEASDAPAIREVARDSWHAAYDDLLGPDRVDGTVDEWYAVADLETAIGDSVFHVAVSADDTVIGFANAGPNPAYEEGTDELYRIYVHPDHWGAGVGGRLLDAVEADLREAGAETLREADPDDRGDAAADRLRVSVLAENTVGVDFYESHGFERVARGTVELGGETYTDYDYLKSL
jgi:GNAT superfamily N-acetyltransferase